MEKKTPIERTWAEFMNVPLMPAPAPRWSAGRLFMTAIWLGVKNIPKKKESKKTSRAKGTYEKFIGSSSRRR